VFFHGSAVHCERAGRATLAVGYGENKGHGADMSDSERRAGYGAVSTELALLSDHQLARLVDGAELVGHGIGGLSAVTDVAGTPVFVKRIALTDLERRPENVMSTANLFGMPEFCQYGVAGAGFGAWRELAANAMTTGWVLAGRTAAFPLLYHWRVLPGAPPPAAELADVERVVAYWEGSSAVRERINALAAASASVVLFLEYIPDNVADWLAAADGTGVGMVAERLLDGAAFLAANGLLHFDAHFGNIRTDGRRLYFTDLGLATSLRFDLSAGESAFARRHANHDVAYAMTQLVNWLVRNVCGVPVPATGGPVERNDYIRRCARSTQVIDAPPQATALINRYAPVAVVINDFYWQLFGGRPATPYPQAAIKHALSRN
jgi:hypothetical protein